MFNNVYQGKKVLLTGHTGFKGTWLATWLLKLGANVVGVSKDIPTNPSLFEILGLSDKIKHIVLDICDFENINKIILEEKPDFVFHLAAQAIVSISYSDPLETISSNVIGTTNILEALRVSNHKCTAIIVTSDKAYDNIEQIWGYKENDQIGGKDIYSGSKGAAELIFKSFYHSFFKLKNSKIKVAVARAGNVIGGGDWSKNRLIPDCMKMWLNNKTPQIRNPNSTRPWQHVLEALSGYLDLSLELNWNKKINGNSFNFSSDKIKNVTVENFLKKIKVKWPEIKWLIKKNDKFYESSLLQLDTRKAKKILNWKAKLNLNETIEFVVEWYKNFNTQHNNIYKISSEQIIKFMKKKT